MTAVLLVAYRRPDLAAELAARLISQGRRDVWVFVDGPRDGTVAQAVVQTRVALMSAAWPVKPHFYLSDTNLGVGRAVPKACSWVLDKRSEVIVLEDDCWPTHEFFEFAELMLERYRSDLRVGTISGTRLVDPDPLSEKHGYSFSHFAQVWGWATWADRWAGFQEDLKDWRSQYGIADLTRWGGPLHAYDWWRLLNSVRGPTPWSWDYKLNHALWVQNQMCLTPAHDLVENVGFQVSPSHGQDIPTYAPKVATQAERRQVLSEAGLASPSVQENQLLSHAQRRLIYSPPLGARISRKLKRRPDMST
jgi:hypothetical protein